VKDSILISSDVKNRARSNIPCIRIGYAWFPKALDCMGFRISLLGHHSIMVQIHTQAQPFAQLLSLRSNWSAVGAFVISASENTLS
jgi:hypothetical protein